jgi:glycosyltransferase involved in cell wall biosynthesis
MLRVSVVIPTHDRPQRLERTLRALRAQSLPSDEFEVIVVDDGSDPETQQLLEREEADSGLQLRVERRSSAGGPARARNAGWRMARAPLVAFTDDDCEPARSWLAAGLAAWEADAKTFVQGPTLPNPAERVRRGAITHTLEVESLGPWWETANIFYPRAALESAGGFDEEHYSGPGGEDTDLGCRLEAAGWRPVWAADALVYHAVTELSPIDKLRLAWRWDQTMRVFKQHPQLRRELVLGLFWQRNHWWLVRAAIALALPSRLWWLRWWLAAPYVVRLGSRRPDVMAVLLASDVVEIAACIRGGLRCRTPVA